MPSRGIRNRAMRVFLVMGNLAEVHAKNFLRRRVIHRSCGEQILRTLLASMNNSGIAISPGQRSAATAALGKRPKEKSSLSSSEGEGQGEEAVIKFKVRLTAPDSS